jgi:hypothetical protein
MMTRNAMGVSSFPAPKTDRSNPRGDPNPASGERKGVRAWLAAAPAAVSRVFQRSSDAGARGARGGTASGGGGFDLRRFGPFVLFGAIGVAVLAGIAFLATSILQNSGVREPSTVVEQRLDGSTDRAAPPLSGSDVSEGVGRDSQGAEGTKQAGAAAPKVEASNDWILPLTRRQISRYYPPRALEKGIEGSATLRCRFEARRRSPDCTVVRERPDGYRFGSAARRLSRQFEPTSQMVSGEPFSVVVRFRGDE